MAEVRLDSHAQGKARRALGNPSEHHLRGTPKRKIISPTDQNPGRSFPMGRKLADRFSPPPFDVAGTISSNGANY